jgi:hypothetical protein
LDGKNSILQIALFYSNFGEGIDLRVTFSYARSTAHKIGFKILSHLVSHKRVPDGASLYGGQNGLALRK